MGNDKVERSGGTMRTKHLIPTLAVLLVFAACVCTVSAETLTVTGVKLANAGEQGTISLTLDSMQSGLAGYSVSLSFDPSVAEILAVNYPAWTNPPENFPWVERFRSGQFGPGNVNI